MHIKYVQPQHINTAKRSAEQTCWGECRQC